MKKFKVTYRNRREHTDAMGMLKHWTELPWQIIQAEDVFDAIRQLLAQPLVAWVVRVEEAS